jgi:predicted nucleotidyltransferase
MHHLIEIAAPPMPLTYDPAHLDAVCRELDLQMVVLYGSRATGGPPPTPESDLDLAVVGRRPHAATPLMMWHQALADVFDGYALDLARLGTADPLFRYEIFRQGILLYGDLDAFFEYKAFAYRDFVDSADLRALEDALFQKKMAYLRSHLDGAS